MGGVNEVGSFAGDHFGKLELGTENGVIVGAAFVLILVVKLFVADLTHWLIQFLPKFGKENGFVVGSNAFVGVVRGDDVGAHVADGAIGTHVADGATGACVADGAPRVHVADGATGAHVADEAIGAHVADRATGVHVADGETGVGVADGAKSSVADGALTTKVLPIADGATRVSVADGATKWVG